MLRKFSHLLFSYRDVPQAFTRFSPFKLLYGWEVKGPPDILPSSARARGMTPRLPTNLAGFDIRVWVKLDQLSSMAHKQLAKAKTRQKTPYDQTATSRIFTSGRKVLSLPSSESCLQVM